MSLGIPSSVTDAHSVKLNSVENFSLVLGGPLYQLLNKARLGDIEHQIKRRILAICAIIWLPLLLLCGFDGTLISGIDVPFLFDIETHARFLIAVALLIYAELLVHQRIRGIVSQFLERKLVPDESISQFHKAIDNAIAWRNSIPAELMLILVVYTLGYYLRADVMVLKASTWYATIDADGSALTVPGLWYFWVSNPITQFLFIRWGYRIAIWARFLWQVSRIKLNLIPTHPDRNGGLGFLSNAAYAYSPLLTALGVIIAGFIANRIFHDQASLVDYKLEIVTFAVLGIAIVLGPMLVFMQQLLSARRVGLREYGIFATQYTRDFDRRWIRSVDNDGEALLGSGDIQSLADLGNAYTVIKEMRPVPFTRDMFVQLIMASVFPFFPLMFTLFPVDVMLDRIIGVVF